MADYVVLARKHRPRRFAELIGQETAARALRNAVVAGRTAHAYLFAGSRGVGKTSAARILTKALNCLAPLEGEPCDTCDHCVEITRDASPDVYEIDAASNRGIDNIRELRENTKYAPAKCAYKTYIIDEVHMLTAESFNALLKTLEEPPPHVRFILATTAPQRIPETILSRCQRFDFPRIALGPMVEHLAAVTAAEGITLERPSLELIARHAEGGMRDALTAVDQVVAFAGPTAGHEQVLGVLGVMDTGEVLALLGAVLDKAVEPALAAFATIMERGHDLPTLLEALLREVKDFSLYLSLKGQSTLFEDRAPAALEFFAARANAVTLDELQQIFYLLLELEGQLRQSEHTEACFEMALMKACRVEPLVGVAELLAQARALAGDAHAHRPAAPPSAQTEQRPAAAAQPRAREVGAPHGAASPSGEQDAEAEPASPPHAREAEAPSGKMSPAPASTPASAPAASPAEAVSASAAQAGTAEPAAAPSPNAANGSGQAETGARVSIADPADAVADAASEREPDDGSPRLCEDERWVAFVDEVRQAKRLLGAELRRVEVAAIGERELEVVLPDGGDQLAGAPLASHAPVLEPALVAAFGGPFRLRLIHATGRSARPGHTLVGRERELADAEQAARVAAARDDDAVRRILRFFPDSKIERVNPNPEPPEGRKDV